MTDDAADLDGLSEEDLRRRYDQGSRSSVNVPGRKEDFSDMVAKEMAKKKQKAEQDRDRGKKGKDFKF